VHPDGMSNVLSNEKQQQVLGLCRLGWSLGRIGRETGVRRETAGKYAKINGITLRPPGRWGHPPPAKAAKETITDSGVTDSKAAIEVITDSVGPPARVSGSACTPHREFIEQALVRGRNAMAIWQDLVDEHGFEARYASVSRFVRRLRGEPGRQARAIIRTPAGQEAQVDYGTGPLVRDPQTGKYRRTRLFIMTLGFSRKSVRLLAWKSSSRVWCELHEQAFRRLGGVPEVVVLDNLREGVIKADFYDPALNPLYRDMLAHYGVVALPCRVRDPDRKGKVESAVGHTQSTALKGKRFELMSEAQAHLDHWDSKWADTRIHGTTKRQVAAMFAEEKPQLRPLPIEPFRYYEHGTRKVHLDGCVEVRSVYYGAPPNMVGQEIHVQWDELFVRLLDPRTGQLLREHQAQVPGRYRLDPDDRPKRTPPGTRALLQRAEKVGPSVGKVSLKIIAHDEVAGVRRVQGLLSLVKKQGPSQVEQACAEALALSMPTYQFVKRYVGRKPAPQLTLKQVDPLIRELTQYRDVIQSMSKGEPS